MKLTCRKSPIGLACRFDEAHHLAAGAEYSLVVVADDFREAPGPAVAEISAPGDGRVASSAELGMDPTGTYRDRAFGLLVTTGGVYDDLLSAGLADKAAAGKDGPVVVPMRFRVTMRSANAPFIDCMVPVVLAASPCHAISGDAV